MLTVASSFTCEARQTPSFTADRRPPLLSRGRGCAFSSGVAMDTSYHEKTKKIQEETLAQSYAVARAQVSTIELPPKGSTAPVCFLDLGSADGLNTIPLFQQLVAELRERESKDGDGGRRSVQLVFEDQPCNDFSRIHDIDAAVEFGEAVYPSTTSVSFFDCTVPPGTAHLSFSSHSMHYLSQGPPLNFKTTGLKDTDAPLGGEERLAFAAAAATDWEKLVMARVRELAPGGRSIISNLCIDGAGWYYGSTDYGRSLYTELSECLKSMAADGLITDTEYEWATSPEYFRTVAELREPFGNDGTATFAGTECTLNSADIQITRCPWRQEWLDGKHSDALEYGRTFANVVTSFSYNKCARAFTHPGNARSEEEKTGLLAEVYERFAHRVAEDPASIGIDTVSCVMVIERLA